MGKRQRRRRRDDAASADTTEYRGADGNMLELRNTLSAGTIAKLREPAGGPAATSEDMWRRRTELLFERLAVSWTVAELPLTAQKELLGRYRLASSSEREAVRKALAEHLSRRHPELDL